MRHRLTHLALLLGLIAVVGMAASPSFAVSAVSPQARVQAPHVTVSLLSEAAAIRPGEPFTLGLHFDLDEHWHVYWKNPGDSGLEPRVRWTLPEGFTASPLRWPAPSRIRLKHLVNFGYEGEVVLLAEITPPPGLSPGQTVRIAAKIDWLVCEEECIPGSASLAVDVPVADLAVRAGDIQPLFDAARLRLPVFASRAGWEASAIVGDGVMELTVEGPGGAPASPPEAVFFPDLPGWVRNAGEQQVSVTGNTLTLRVPLDTTPGITVPNRVLGVLVAGSGWPGANGSSALRIDIPLSDRAADTTSPPLRQGAADVPDSLPLILLGAAVGGLILNLMPCVLPVLSLKVLGFVRASELGRHHALTHAIVFAAGIVVSFWVVATLLLALRAAGGQLGWGFQLQSPTFVVVMAALFLLMGLNLFGVFEIGVGLTSIGGTQSSRQGLLGAFFSGVLATVVATPCTAPFMGTALGVALTGSRATAFGVFTALALGMALPYVVLAASPGLLGYIPKPGPWMDTLKKAMGFMLLLAVVWLAWVFGHQAPSGAKTTGVDEVAWLMLGLLVVGMGACALGHFGDRLRPKPRPWLARALVVLGVGVGLWLPLRAISAPVTGPAWEPYSSDRIAALEQAGHPYFIDFTAGWCLSCQVNQVVALDRRGVAEVFDRHGITAIKADWTNQDTVIADALAAYGRVSVPLYVLETGRDNKPAVILPNLLTEAIVIEALRGAGFD